MHAAFSTIFITLTIVGAEARPEPRPLVGDALLPGAVARLGPTAFYYAKWVPQGHAGGVPRVFYSPDGKRVAVTANTGVSAFDAATGKRLVWVPADGHAGAAALGFAADGDMFVTCWRAWDEGGAGTFRIDPLTGKVKARFQPAEGRNFGPVTADGTRVFSRTATANVNETVANDPNSGKELWRRKMSDSSWMRLSPDGSRLVTWTSAARWSADVLDTATGKTVGQLTHPDYGCTPTWTSGGLAVSAKGEYVVSAHGWDRGFSVFKSGTEKPAHRENGAWDDNAFFPRDGTKFVLLRDRPNSSVEVWDAATGKRVSSAKAELGGVAVLSPDGKTLAVAGHRANPHALQFFDVATGKRRAISPDAFTQAEVVWYQPDGTLASAGVGLVNPVSWNQKTGAMSALPAGTKPLAPPKVPEGFAPPAGTTGLVASPAGTRVLGVRVDPDELDSSPGDTYLGLFDAKGKLVKWFPRPDSTLGASYRFAPDGKTFAVSRGDGTLTLFDAADGAEVRSFRTAGGAGSMAFAPDGRHLALAGGDGPIVVWDMKAAKK